MLIFKPLKVCKQYQWNKNVIIVTKLLTGINKAKLCLFQFTGDKSREDERIKNRGQNSTNGKERKIR